MPVKAGDIVVEFDPADQQYALEQAKSELDEAEQTIVKMKADAAVQASQDEVALLTAKFDVRRGELDTTANEFIGALEAQKNVLSLEEARRRLAQLLEDMTPILEAVLSKVTRARPQEDTGIRRQKNTEEHSLAAAR